jgi:hypothetical protein
MAFWLVDVVVRVTRALLGAVARLAGSVDINPPPAALCPLRSWRRIAGAQRRSTGRWGTSDLLSPSAPEGKPIHRQRTLSSGTPATYGRSRSAGGLAIAITIDRRSSRLPIARCSLIPCRTDSARLTSSPMQCWIPSLARLWSTARTSARPRILEPSLSSLSLGLPARFNVLRVESNPCCQRGE